MPRYRPAEIPFRSSGSRSRSWLCRHRPAVSFPEELGSPEHLIEG